MSFKHTRLLAISLGVVVIAVVFQIHAYLIQKEQFEFSEDQLPGTLTVYQSPFPKIRVGNNMDGGYIICASPELTYDGFLSGGISNDISFEVGFIELHPHVVCHAFDGSIDTLPHNHPNIVFHKLMLGNDNTSTTSNAHDIINRHSSLMVKMDIEGGEYAWLRSLSDEQLSKFSQIVIEFHDPYDSDEKFQCLTRLQHTHWLVHLHGNNCAVPQFRSVRHLQVPHVFECTYISKKFASDLKMDTTPIPGDLDNRNCHDKEDVRLDDYPFFFSNDDLRK